MIRHPTLINGMTQTGFLLVGFDWPAFRLVGAGEGEEAVNAAGESVEIGSVAMVGFEPASTGLPHLSQNLKPGWICDPQNWQNNRSSVISILPNHNQEI
jgi:hypothetical protein